MSTHIKLQTAIHIALGVSVGALAASYVPLASAQEQDTDEDYGDVTVTEEVIVTGSRIRRADIDSASPITVLSREDIEVGGLTDVGNIIQRMPSMSGSPIGTTTNNGGNGAVLVDLRGMGTDRTVTLINGQRVVDGGDYQTIPSTMIDRVEILKDGASAVYGADAVAGVVNIITRKDFEGLEFTVQQADWFDSGGKQDTVGFIGGTEFGRGNFVFGAEFVNQEEAYQADTPWDFFKDSFYIYPEGCENDLTAPYPQGCYRLGSSSIPEGNFVLIGQPGRFLIGTPASSPNQAGVPIPHDGRNYNYAPVNYMQTPFERTNVFGEMNFDLTDNVRFKAEFRGNYRESAQELAPTPLFTILGDPAYDGFFNGAPYHGVSPDNYYLRQAIDNYNAATGENIPYSPAIDVRRRMFEQPRRFTQEIAQYQFVAGLEGEFNDMNWDIYANQGYRSRQDQDFGQYVGEFFANALGPSADLDGDGIPECYADINDPATLIGGCVPLNLFGGGTVTRETGEPTVSTVTQEMLDYFTHTLNDSFRTKQTLFGGSLSGSLFELPGGTLGWAAGYGYWKQEFKFIPDSGKAAGTVTGNKSTPTDGSLTNNGLFLEVLAPLFDNGTQELIVKGGYRYDDYDAFDSDSTYQIGVEFQAVEQLKLRTTYGTVFRAPTISDLFAGQSDSFPTFSDPCAPDEGGIAPGCAQEAPGDETQARARVGGNPNVVPETGDTFTAGIVWTPSIGDHNFTATVDYWEIDIEDGISSLGVQFILEDCYVNLNPSSCDLITRRPSDYGIDQIIDGALNVAEQGAKGVDTEVRWGFSSDVGQWEAAFLWSHLIERTKTPFPGAPEDDLSGRSTDPTAQDGGTYAEDKANVSLQWFRNDLSIGYLGEYISGLDADTFCNCGAGNQPDGSYIQDIDSVMFHDLVASYTFNQGLKLSLGVTNVTDEPPPFIEVGFNGGTDPSVYRLFGRGYFLRAGWSF